MRQCMVLAIVRAAPFDVEPVADIVNSTSDSNVIGVERLKNILLFFRQLLSGRRKPVHILNCLPKPLLQNIDLINTGQDTLLAGIRIMAMRHAVKLRAAKARHFQVSSRIFSSVFLMMNSMLL